MGILAHPLETDNLAKKLNNNNEILLHQKTPKLINNYHI